MCRFERTAPVIATLTSMKRVALILLVCASCKSSDSKPAAPPAADDTPTRVEHHASAAPALPPSAEEGSNRPALPDDRPWRHRRDHRMDGSDDGSAMSPEARQAERHARVESMRARFDTNGDGKLTPDELRNAPGRMHFDNPEELDTNHDGDISVDELEAGMQARRDAFRAQRAAERGDGSGATAP
jgi:hypothetical protein